MPSAPGVRRPLLRRGPQAGPGFRTARRRPCHLSRPQSRPRAKVVLFVAFAFAIMADPVSSVAYTIEASLRALHGYLGLLLATQVSCWGSSCWSMSNYWQLVGRFPMGGGSAEAAARAFGTGWVFVPIGALIVDFVLTITISIAAGVSALIAYLPALAPARIVLGLGLLVLVAGLTWFGHGGRLDVRGDDAAVHRGRGRVSGARLHPSGAGPWPGAGHRAGRDPLVRGGVLVPGGDGAGDRHRGAVHRHRPARPARPGRPAPVRARHARARRSSSSPGSRSGWPALAVRLHVGIPGPDSTQIADVAHAAAGSGSSTRSFRRQARCCCWPPPAPPSRPGPAC